MASRRPPPPRRGATRSSPTTRRSRGPSPRSGRRSSRSSSRWSAYIVVACAEAFLRYPEHGRPDRRRHARRGDRPAGPGAGLPGRQLLPLVDRQLPAHRPPGVRRCSTRPATRRSTCSRSSTSGTAPRAPYRGGDGTRQAWDTGTATPYDDGDDRRAARARRGRRRRRTTIAASIKRFNATLVNYLFLLYFDTRAGYCDTGPYAVPGHPERTLLVRDFYRLGTSDFWWSDVGGRRPVLEPDRRLRARGRHVPRSPTSARRTTRPRTTSTASSASRSTRPTAATPGEVRPVPVDELDAHRRRGAARRSRRTTGTSRR